MEAAYAYSKTTDLIAKLDSYADFHQGSDLKNKDKTINKIDLGVETILSAKKAKKNRLYIGLFYDTKSQNYYDRDTGTAKISGVTDISDKYSYDANGVQLKYRSRTTTPRYQLKAEIGSRDYTDTVVNSDQDYDYVALQGDVEFDLTKQLEMGVGYAHETQDYSERHARDLNGSLFSTSPLLKYTYQDITVSLKQAFNENWSGKIEFIYATRDDAYLGYNDYEQNKIALDLIYKTKDLKHKFFVDYSTRDYLKAFAYENPTQPNKTYDTQKIGVSSELKQTEHRSLWGEVKYYNVDTNDLRYNYDNMVAIVGVKYEY